MAWKAELSAADRINRTSLLFLQDRIGEALTEFDQIQSVDLLSNLQYDYLKATALFYRGQPQQAAILAKDHLTSLPPGTWKDRFQAVSDQASEVAALNESTKLPDAPDLAPARTLQLTSGAGGELLLKHHGFKKATLEYFQIDLEVLFSKNPFLQADRKSSEPPMMPNHTAQLVLSDKSAETNIEIPDDLKSGNLLVVAKSGDSTSLHVLDDSPVIVRELPLERTLQIFNTDTSKPVSKVYVKVYAEDQSGEVSFHKDGYTDLRGKFDYLTHTGEDISTIKRVAVLILSPENHIARTLIYQR